MSGLIGAIIRRERLRRNYSQEGLCRGICAVSYLSKIEQGKAEVGSDILLPLLERLGIRYETDPLFLSQAEGAISALYEWLFAGMDILPPFQEKLDWLAGHRERCLSSPYMLDTLLFLAYSGRAEDEALAEFAPCMTRQQYEFYLLTRLQAGAKSVSEELLRLNPCAFYSCAVGIARYRKGRYPEAASLLNRSYDLAAREGNVYLMLQAKVFLGNCYSDCGQKELMREQYQVARKLAAAVNCQSWVSTIDYNLGSSLLEWGLTEEAYSLLQTVPRRDALHYHKLAVALEKLGRRDEAISMVEKARGAGTDSFTRPVIKGMLDLVEYRLRNPNYLRDEAYSRLMADTFALLQRSMPSGYVRFHVPYMLEVLEAERRYRDAYRLSMEFSDLPSSYRH